MSGEQQRHNRPSGRVEAVGFLTEDVDAESHLKRHGHAGRKLVIANRLMSRAGWLAPVCPDWSGRLDRCH